MDERYKLVYRVRDDQDAAELGELWEAAGLRAVRTGGVRVRADYASFDDLMHPFAAGVGHSGASYASLDEGRRAQLRAHVRTGLGDPDGPLTLTARAWWVRGTSD